jgi:hypothetical protein
MTTFADKGVMALAAASPQEATGRRRTAPAALASQARDAPTVNSIGN